jgi:acyl-coenzyme A thioesterase PaaI-like protein
MPSSEPPDNLVHFQAIPWCADLLSSPDYVLTSTFSRHPKPRNEDSLFAHTLNSALTIPHIQSLYRRPTPPETFVSELLTLVTLSTGLNGGPDALHGGIIATLMDDVKGLLLTVNTTDAGEPLSASAVTARMEVRFERRVPTPGTYVVGARCTRREGRKIWLEGWIMDGEGRRCASSESLWVFVRAGL